MKLMIALHKITEEYHNSNTKFNEKFASTSEWLGVIREEYVEFEKAIFLAKGQYVAENDIRDEAIQIGAMILKGLISLCEDDPVVPLYKNEKPIEEDDPEHD